MKTWFLILLLLVIVAATFAAGYTEKRFISTNKDNMADKNQVRRKMRPVKGPKAGEEVGSLREAKMIDAPFNIKPCPGYPEWKVGADGKCREMFDCPPDWTTTADGECKKP